MMWLLHIAAFPEINSTREFGQSVVTGIVNGANYALLGMGFALILGVTTRFHFAYGITFTFAAYIAAVATGPWGFALVPALILGLLVGIVIGVACEGIVYRPLAARAGAQSLLAIFVASLGIVIAGENLIPEIWGNNTRPLSGFPDHTYHVAQLVFTKLEITLVIVAIVVAIVVTLMLNRTILGQQIKAVSANPDMASVVGVNVGRIFLIVFAIGSLIAGIAAVFQGMRFSVTPTIGDTAVFYAFVVAFVAGVQRSPWIVALVGLGFGLVESVSTLWVSQTESSLTTFGLLLVWLTIRVLPTAIRELRGAFGGRARRAPSARVSKAA